LQIFYRLDPDRTIVFCEVAAESMATLLSFGDSVAKSKKSPEKLFVLLDMYETLRDLMPDVSPLRLHLFISLVVSV
jgi:exocyst complex protein 7